MKAASFREKPLFSFELGGKNVKTRWIFLLTAVMLLMTVASSCMAEPQYRIGICQLVQHAALEDATQGFVDAVREQMGDRAEIKVQNASGDPATCISIVNAFLAEDVDLILANSTQALQAASAATGDTPILGVAVTDYPAALDMDTWDGKTYINVSGTSDLAPLEAQAELIQTLFPEAKQIGLLYCSSEVNSTYQVRVIREHLQALGFACAEYAFTDTNDVFSVTQSACQGSDVIFVPTDNTIASCTELIRNVIEIEMVPVVGGDEGICSGCGVATICIDYYDLGYATGVMACDILENGADITRMPIAYSPSFTRIVNAEMCEYLGIAVPEAEEPAGN